MATTKNIYIGNGSTRLFTFSWPYLDDADVRVQLDDTPQVNPTNWELVNANTVRFVTAPPVGSRIAIYRRTAVDDLFYTFYPGSAIKAKDLNSDFGQVLFVAQEARSQYLDVELGGEINGNIIFNGDLEINGESEFNNLVNFNSLVDFNSDVHINQYPTQDNDAVNKLYVDTQDAALKVYVDAQDQAIYDYVDGQDAAIYSYVDAQDKSYDDAVRAWATSEFVDVSGDSMTGDLNMAGNKVVNLGTPSSSGDAVNFGYAETTYVNVSGDTMTGQLAMSNQRITSLGSPKESADAVNKQYVDGILQGTGGNISSLPVVRFIVKAGGGETVLNPIAPLAPGNEIVTVNGSTLTPSDDYTVTKDRITLRQPLLKGDEAMVLSYNSLKVVEVGANFDTFPYTRWVATATAGQTVFTGSFNGSLPLAYSVGFESVFLNGALLTRDVDYAANDQTSINLTQGAQAGDVLDVHSCNYIQTGTVQGAGGITYTYPGGVEQTVQQRLEQYVSVKDFGAKGDGITDDTAAFKEALEYVNTSENTTKGTRNCNLFIPGGIYILSETIYQTYPYINDLTNNSGNAVNKTFPTVFGEGRDTTILKHVGGKDIAWSVGSPTSYANAANKGCYGIGLKDLTITTSETPGEQGLDGLDIGGVHYGTFENLAVTKFPGRCVNIEGNYSDGIGCLWNKFTQIKATGDKSMEDRSVAIRVFGGANSNSFYSCFFSLCRVGVYAGGSRNCYYSISGETQTGSIAAFKVNGPFQMFGCEFEQSGGEGTGRCAFEIDRPVRGTVFGAKCIGYNQHILRSLNTGEIPEVSFIDGTYEDTSSGTGALYRNIRYRPPLDKLILPSPIRHVRGVTYNIPEGSWSAWNTGSFFYRDNDWVPYPEGESYYLSRQGYFNVNPLFIEFYRADTAGTMGIEWQLTPFDSNSVVSLQTIQEGEQIVRVSYNDIVEILFSNMQGANTSVFPRFRFRASESGQNVSFRLMCQPTA